MIGTSHENRSRGYRFLEPKALSRLKSLPLIARGVVEGFISGLHASPYKGFSVEFADRRSYSAGDNPRHLDWKTLARTDRLFIRQYEEETNLRARILLDVSGSMHYGSPERLSKVEYGCYLAAVLTYLMTRQQDAVGITTFDHDLRLDMPARSSPRHLAETLRQLEVVVRQARSDIDHPGPATDIGNTLHRLAERFQRRSLIILISDLYDDADSLARALHHFRHRRHELIVFHILDHAELTFPFRETLQFVDLETAERLQVDPTYVREVYLEQVDSFTTDCRRRCAKMGIDYVLTDTSVPYDFLLFRYLAKRNRL